MSPRESEAMNFFELGGTVAKVEERRTRFGTPWFLVTVRAGEEEVPAALFGDTLGRTVPRVGQSIAMKGRLTARNGFLAFAPSEVRLDGENPRPNGSREKSAGYRPPPPGARKPRPGEGPKRKPETAHFEDDGSLPF